jgi:class 3 adenylate cyclase/tetratricopeptide (TPR) repeat protein
VQRKVVTVLFCDVVGSTALGESVDPEALRSLLARYFEEMKTVVERHGGTVEKFIGDAVMAVFGVPAVREDDALRAVRAAEEMRAALPALGIEGRIGVNTGEVVTGTNERLATGDAVNVAARLEQAAEPGEILLGEPTFALVRHAVVADAAEPLELKGKSTPLPAWRLRGLVADAPSFTRREDAPFIGRRDELELLRADLVRAVADQACRLCTIVGPAGIGKSRLTGRFLSEAGQQAKVVVGRCLSYGEGITFRPLAEVVRDAVGADVREAIEALVAADDAALVAGRVAGAVGAADASIGPPEETFWAFRRLFEELATDRPLIVVVDDIQWAEPTLLDLLEYVVAFARDAPILVLCVARPELFEARPTWAAPRPNATVISLPPLSDGESTELVERLLGRRASRVIETAEGNPLFLEQLVAMQAEDEGEPMLPPTLQALLAARIDRLGPDERAVVECASVEGRTFHRGAVAELLEEPRRAALGASLIDLVRKELVQPDSSEFPGDDGFRFGHVLIRDAAYAATSKQLRAELHVRFADWLESRIGERLPEYEEVLGFHLEQAARFRSELGTPDVALAARAGVHLASAGRRALTRGYVPAAVNLLERAAALPGENRHLLLEDLGVALNDRGDLARAQEVLDDAIELAAAAGDHHAQWRSRIARLWVIENVDVAYPPEEVEREAREAIDALSGSGDDRALARAWRLLSEFHNTRCHGARWQEAIARAVEHARRTDDLGELYLDLWLLSGALFFGPATVAEGEATLEALATEMVSSPVAEAAVLRGLAGVRGQQGRFDEARELLDRVRYVVEDRGLVQSGAGIGWLSGSVELLAGDSEAAEREIRESVEALGRLGMAGRGASLALLLARALAVQERDAEAERVIQEWTAPAQSPGGWADWAFWAPAIQALALARRGRVEEAERLVRSAVSGAERTDFLNWRGDVLLDLAHVLGLAGKPGEARSAVESAVELYARKGNVASEAAARALL